MKKILYIFIILFSLSSCVDLDLNPNDRPSSGSFWKNDKDFEFALTAAYGSMRRNMYSFSTPCWDNLTDNGYGQHAEGQYGLTTNMVQGNTDPSSGGFVSLVYLGAFSDVARVNIFLKNLREFPDLDNNRKKTMEAEARMLRAFFYSYLYRGYGEVPIIAEPLTLETQYQEKKSEEEVFKFIIDDLDFAIANLQNLTYNESSGRWTVNAAKAYKARMLLYTAYDNNGNAISSKMNEAKSLLSDIDGYTLSEDFSDNFLDNKQESSPEIMMSIKFLAPNVIHGADMWYSNWIVVSPLINFIEEFEMKDGSPGEKLPKISNNKFTLNTDLFTNASMQDRDSRLEKTVFINKYIVNDNEYTPSNARPTGIGLSKFISKNLTPPYDRATLSQQDWIITRYADILLMLAEAENELNGATPLAYNSINQIRNRAGMPDLPAGLSKEEMRERIRHERRIELAFEGHRFFDLKRWKTAKVVLNAVQDAPVVYKFEEKHYLWPIPQSEIDKNQGKLIQNKDYK